MGDGGVACVPLQHVMATISETLCGGNGGSNGVSNGNGFNSMGVNMRLVDLNSSLPEEEEEEELEKNMDLERRGFGAEKEEFEKSSLDSDEWQLREGVKLQKLEENGKEESTSLNVELERQDFCLEKGEFENSTAGSDEEQKGEQVKLQKLGEWQKVEMENGKEESTSLKMELDGLHFRSEKGEFRKSASGLDEGQQGERVKLQKLVEWKKAEVENGKEESASLQPQQQYRRVDLVKEKFGLVNGKKRSSDVEEVQKGEIFKLSKGGVGNWGIVSEKRWKGGEVEKEEIVPEKSMKGEIVKGEVVSEKWRKEEIEKGEFASEKRRNIGEIENGEIVLERWQMGDIESGEFSSVRVSKGEIEKGEFVPEKWQRGSEVGKAGLSNGCKEDIEKGEFIPDRRRNGEVEKGEIVSERRRKREARKQEFSSLGKGRKQEVEKGEFVPEKGWKDDLDHSPKKEMPQSLKYAEEDFSQQKDCNRSCIDRWKRSNRWTSDSKSSSRTLDGENESHKHDHVGGKNHAREYTSQSSSCKHHGDFGDHSASKSGRVTDDNNHSSYPEKLHLHRLVERSNRNSSSLKDVPLNRYSRHYDSYSSSRGGSDRHRRSPGHHKQSPRERTRYKDRSPGRAGYSVRSPHKHTRHHDHRDRIPGRLSYLDRSPREWARHRDDRDHTPGHLERSPYDRARHRDRKEHSPGRKERSPHDRARHRDHREHSPAHSERSPRARARNHDRRDPSPIYLEQSPRDRGRSHGYRETKQKSGCQKRHSQCGGQGHEEKLGQESGGIDSDRHSSGIQSNDVSTLSNSMHCPNENVDDQASKEKGLHGTTAVCNEFPSQDNEILEELPSMEEDMDICDTPPHVPAVLNSSTGKWFYFNHFGIEQGPSKLCDLRRLVEEGFLQSDHLIKHSDINRWVTVENAASPLVPVNLPSIVSDTVTELVTPPEAPGNLLGDVGDVSQPEVHLDESPMASESLEDLQIDERVKALLDGYTLVPGMELETLGEALHVMFEHADWERWSSPEGFSRSRGSCESSRHPREEEFDRGFDSMLLKETVETRLAASSEEISFLRGEPSDWFASLWSCKGGDWKRNDEVAQDRCFKRKLVLNNGYPLCLMPKSGYEDPRGQRKDDLYYPSCSRKLDLPQWAFTLMDEKNDTNSDVNKNTLANRSGQLRPSVVRGVKGTVLPVTRINACVVKDYGSSVSEPHAKVRESERHISRFIQSVYVSSGDSGSLSTEAISRSIKVHGRDLQTLSNCRTIISIPKDRVCTVDELQLELGDWYYLDGAGHEHGPLLFSELQTLASQGVIPKGSSAFRKIDKVWVPISTGPMASGTINAQPEKVVPTTDSSAASYPLSQFETCVNDRASSSFHNAHPQFIGYTRGKLHELVMKSYRSREFAAAINEVLDPWISTRQAKKETDKHFPFNSSIMNDTADLAHGLLVQNFRKPESGLSRIYGDCNRVGKRPRLLFEESDKEDEMEEDLLIYQRDECSFEDLCGEAASSQAKTESCGLLSDHILARVFHFLRSDLKSLAISASTCRYWNTAIKFYRDISRQVDLSSLGSNCTDSIFQNIMSCYNKTKITSIGLIGCTNVSAAALEEALHSFPCITSVDIRGCNQFHELRSTFKDVKWIGYRGSHKSKNFEESHSKMKGLKQIPDKRYLNSFSDDSNLDRKDSTSYAFRQSSYRRTKFLNARKFSAVLSRDVHLRRLLRKKSENGYKRMEEFLSTSLKDIMKENKSEFFIPKVAEIEDRMRNGYYIGHGLSFVKDDISRMCRDAIKAKNRVGARDMNHIIMLFIRLAKSLEENAKSSARLSSAALTYKKKRSNVMSERKAMNRSNGTSYTNGGMDHENYASDREIRRRLSKLNRRSFDSESETSDDLDLSEDDGRGDAENSNSDTESDLDLHSEGGNGDLRDGNSFIADESLESMIEDREWGARMTKVSLVPPVTRKYEVIDHYVIVADEEEVQRKMQVALPDDYTEKLRAQKNGIEESDMEIPEVKDYKPRKRLGDEVLEQEVYGIDPYTHNLLLDSMPEELEWPHLERHLFIEEVLLRALNKQVRYFTGTGSTPMVYPLQPVLEEIRKTAEEEGDTHVMKMCQGIVKAMHNRPEDNYVAYRKGLGVLCNKEEGFAEDDFVVEFLGEVYPAWKWFEKQDGIRSMQKNNKDPAPEFYNIYLERPKGDCDGYDLVVVDAMHKANYASRICHSCRPNCEAKVTAVDGQYQIGIYTVRPIRYGEEITFDYNSVTESKEEYEASVCLCGSQVCRGSYLNLTGEGAFQKVIKECHGLLDRHQLMLEACELNYVSQEDYIDLGRAGFGTCLLAGLPDWLIAYSAHLVRFINFERTKLPDEILKHNLEEKKRFFADICLEVEKSEAEIQAEGVYNQRLQNLALTLDKVRYVMRCVFGDPRKAPPPLEKISPEALVSVLWKGEDSLVQELLQCMAPHMEADSCSDLKSKIGAHDPSGSDDLQRELKKSLLWLRDEIRNLPCTYKCRHDAAADLIHMYAHTKCFFKVRGYKSITSPPVYISPLDLGPKYADKLGTGFQEYCKTYGENYCLGQLIYWHIQTNAEPDCNLARARRGCLSLPDIASFYVKSQKPLQKCVYGPRTIKFMLSSMEKYPQRTWPKDRVWTFKSTPRILGSPMLDAVFNKSGLDTEMVQWLKSRPFVFQATWDR